MPVVDSKERFLLAYFWMKDHPPKYYGMLPDGDHIKKTVMMRI